MRLAGTGRRVARPTRPWARLGDLSLRTTHVAQDRRDTELANDTARL